MAHQFGIDLSGMADQPDGERLPLVACLAHLVQRLFVVDGLQSATITESDIIRWLYRPGSLAATDRVKILPKFFNHINEGDVSGTKCITA